MHPFTSVQIQVTKLSISLSLDKISSECSHAYAYCSLQAIGAGALWDDSADIASDRLYRKIRTVTQLGFECLIVIML